jgi:hypothetical protein
LSNPFSPSNMVSANPSSLPLFPPDTVTNERGTPAVAAAGQVLPGTPPPPKPAASVRPMYELPDRAPLTPYCDFLICACPWRSQDRLALGRRRPIPICARCWLSIEACHHRPSSECRRGWLQGVAADWSKSSTASFPDLVPAMCAPRSRSQSAEDVT